MWWPSSPCYQQGWGTSAQLKLTAPLCQEFKVPPQPHISLGHPECEWQTIQCQHTTVASETVLNFRFWEPSITPILFAQSFWKFAQSTTVLLPCSVQNFKTIGYLSDELWTNEILQNLSWRGVSEGYHMSQQHQFDSGQVQAYGEFNLTGHMSPKIT